MKQKAMDSETFRKSLPSMMDLSEVKADSNLMDVYKMVDLAKEIRPAAVFTMPTFTEYTVAALRGSGITVGGVVGFPSGAGRTETKKMTAAKLLELGCGELDMVINQGLLKSGMDERVREDIAEIVKVAGKVPLKVILEVTNLDKEQIVRGCRLAAEAGAAYVKTGTGWSAKPTQLEHIKLMRASVPDSVKIKAAGGIRTIEAAYGMYLAGASRFGVSSKTALALLGETLHSQNVQKA